MINNITVAFLGRIGFPELILILVIVLLLFGAKKLPEIAKALGLGLKEFKKSVKDIKDDISDEQNTKSEEKNSK
ncbi:twin-arginine translocase TatA/TatE family subunit [bacterium]|nr:twin-arginine translocase TatA/TatE family subunit [bacterium]